MRKKALEVGFDVREPTVVELTLGEQVQMDRLAPSHHGYVAERHGALLQPGVATLWLEPGYYFFKTLSDAKLPLAAFDASVTAAPRSPGPRRRRG